MAKQEISIPGTTSNAVITEQGPVFTLSPYVSFVSLKSAAFAKVAPFFPDLQEGEPILFGVSDKPIRLQPFRFVLLHAEAHWSECDSATGEILRSVLDQELAKEEGRKLAEHVETVLLVFALDRLIPARCTFKTTKTKAAWTAIRTLKDARDDALWSKLSAEHKATLVSKDPRFRFATSVKLSFGNTSRSSGHKFTVATGISSPTSVADWQLIADALKDEKVQRQIKDCEIQWRSRLAEIEALSAE